MRTNGPFPMKIQSFLQQGGCSTSRSEQLPFPRSPEDHAGDIQVGTPSLGSIHLLRANQTATTAITIKTLPSMSRLLAPFFVRRENRRLRLDPFKPHRQPTAHAAPPESVRPPTRRRQSVTGVIMMKKPRRYGLPQLFSLILTAGHGLPTRQGARPRACPAIRAIRSRRRQGKRARPEAAVES